MGKEVVDVTADSAPRDEWTNAIVNTRSGSATCAGGLRSARSIRPSIARLIPTANAMVRTTATGIPGLARRARMAAIASMHKLSTMCSSSPGLKHSESVGVLLKIGGSGHKAIPAAPGPANVPKRCNDVSNLRRPGNACSSRQLRPERRSRCSVRAQSRTDCHFRDRACPQS
jgi:hypothetical protein